MQLMKPLISCIKSTAVADCAVVRGLNLANKTDLQWGLNNINYNYLFIILLFFIVMVIQHLLWFNLYIYNYLMVHFI